MKIGSSTDPFNPGAPSGTRSSAKTAPGADAAAPTSQVSLSDLSRKLSAMEAGGADGAVDSSRVAEIKAAIRNGEFKVNAEVVADKLLQSVHEMLGKNA
jgi:negative regulator of flagellin synthesis FlgM